MGSAQDYARRLAQASRGLHLLDIMRLSVRERGKSQFRRAFTDQIHGQDSRSDRPAARSFADHDAPREDRLDDHGPGHVASS